MQLTAHAYIARGGFEAIPDVLALLRADGIPIEGNPDLYVRTYAAFTLDEARSLRERASLRAVGENGRIFVIAAPTIAPDAQNALLKTLEEPPSGAKFIIIVPSPEMLLPTLRSRVQTLILGHVSIGNTVDAKKFLASSPARRIELLKPFLDKDEDERRDLAGTISFLADLERVLALSPRENREGIRALYRARMYITDRGALTKTLLEQMALLV